MAVRTLKENYTNYPRTLLWLVRGGEVTIGGAEADASPAFKVEVAPFYISKFPITNEQYEAFRPEYRRSGHSPGDRDPAVGVSFEDASAYCAWYAVVARKPFRIPTEVEWEYACRAGFPGKTYFDGDDPETYLWSSENSEDRVPPLGDKKPNGFGLYGMLGGVWDWTCSPYRPYPPADWRDVVQPGERVVLRGGSHRVSSDAISCSFRRAEAADRRFDDVGFRIVKSLR